MATQHNENLVNSEEFQRLIRDIDANLGHVSAVADLMRVADDSPTSQLAPGTILDACALIATCMTNVRGAVVDLEDMVIKYSPAS